MMNKWLVSNCLQKSDEWFALRRRRITGSAIPLCLADEPKIRLSVGELKKFLDEKGIKYLSNDVKDQLISKIPNEDLYSLSTHSSEREKAMKNLAYSVLGNEPSKPNMGNWSTRRGQSLAVSYTHLTLPTIYSV